MFRELSRICRPEGFDGKRSVQTDVWSVGTNLYQFLTGALPFPNKEPSALIAAIMMREFEPLPADIPNNLQNVIAKALAKQPENRYTSANEMREDLRRVLRGEAVSDFIQSDSPQIFPAEQVTQIRKSAPVSANNSQENETVVRSAPNFEKSNLNNQRHLAKPSFELENASYHFIKKIGKNYNIWINVVSVLILVIAIVAMVFLGYLIQPEETTNANFRNPTNQNSLTANFKPTINIIADPTPEKIPTAKYSCKIRLDGSKFFCTDSKR